MTLALNTALLDGIHDYLPVISNASATDTVSIRKYYSYASFGQLFASIKSEPLDSDNHSDVNKNEKTKTSRGAGSRMDDDNSAERQPVSQGEE